MEKVGDDLNNLVEGTTGVKSGKEAKNINVYHPSLDSSPSVNVCELYAQENLVFISLV